MQGFEEDSQLELFLISGYVAFLDSDQVLKLVRRCFASQVIVWALHVACSTLRARHDRSVLPEPGAKDLVPWLQALEQTKPI